MLCRQMIASTNPQSAPKGTPIKAPAAPPFWTKDPTFQMSTQSMNAVRTHLKIMRAGSSAFRIVWMIPQPSSPPKKTIPKMPRTIWPVLLIASSRSLPHNPIGLACAAHGGVVGNQAFAVEVVKAIVHQGHAFFASGLDG